jgi:mono/diheme cytochrome c family protein
VGAGLIQVNVGRRAEAIVAAPDSPAEEASGMRIRAIAASLGLLALAASLPAWAQLALPPGDVNRGRSFALQACSVCHVVAPEQLAPRRIARQPAFSAIANAEGMNGMKLQAILSTPHPIMPNLILTPEEAADVIAYILSLRRR